MEQNTLSKLPRLLLPSPIEQIDDPQLVSAGVSLYLKRDDLIHEEISGNKWRKLKYNLVAAKERDYSTLLTFGGAYSNHLRAVSAAGKYCGFKTVGIIRGESHEPLNWSLKVARDNGMDLSYITRTAYRDKTDLNFIKDLHRTFGDFYLLPEGGSNALALQGCQEIPDEISIDYDIICCPCGTGGTLAGISAGLRDKQRAFGFSVLKEGAFLNADVSRLQQEAYSSTFDNWEIVTDFDFGGFAKSTPKLQEFITDFRIKHNIELERIYVAKMMYGIFTLAKLGRFPRGSKIIAVITGPAEPVL